MNMRLPKYLWDKDPLLSNMPQVDTVIDLTEYEWMAEELENAEREAEQALLEEEFIQACFEEMLAEEEAQWFHFPSQGSPLGQDQHQTPSVWAYTTEQNNTEQKYNQSTSSFSKLNPEAPEFIPRGLAS